MNILFGIRFQRKKMKNDRCLHNISHAIQDFQIMFFFFFFNFSQSNFEIIQDSRDAQFNANQMQRYVQFSRYAITCLFSHYPVVL